MSTQAQTADDLVRKAQAQSALAASATGDDEVEASNQVAQTLQFLQNVIERNATELEELKKKLKEKREQLKNVFENDAQLSTATEEAQKLTESVKQRRSQIMGDPQVTGLKTGIAELNEQKKELEETLSNHLINYFGLTNSKSFDTSSGDQWDFTISARVKGRGAAEG